MGDELVADGGVDRLRLLVSAIAGRTVEVVATEPGGPAWTDGVTVDVDPAAEPPEQIRTAAVQAALLAAGSLAPEIVVQLRRRPALARRYLAVEGHRALVAHEPLLPPSVRSLIDRTIAAAVASPEAALALARTRRPVGVPPAAFGVIRPGRVLAVAELVAAVGEEAGAVGDQASRPLGEGVRLEELDGDDDPDGEDEARDVGQLLSSPVGGQGSVGRLLQRLLHVTREPGGGGPVGPGAPTHAGRARPRGRGRTTTTASPEAAAAAGVAAFGPQVRTYPEWDVHRKRYRLDWCTVHERDPRPQDLAPLPPPVPDGLALRRPLARLGAGLDRVRRRPQGDGIDLDAAVEAQVAVRTGEPPAEAVYVESLRHRRDLAVLILLDISGSAAEPGAGGPAGRTVHDHQRAAAAALATATHDLGDRVALYAFNSQGRTAVHVTRVKGFDDRFDGRVVRRLGGLVPGAYTRLGAAIRHGASVLEERGGTCRRLLLVLSDGFAYDHGYGGRYGEADARRALSEARRRGLGCVCLSVGGSTPPAALRRVFGPAAHAAVPTLDRLPGLVGPLFRAALRSAEAERRTFQRKLIDPIDDRRTS